MEFKTPVGGVATVTKVYEGYPAIADSTDASVTTVGIDDDQFVRLVEKCLRERAKSAEEVSISRFFDEKISF
jgi:hypothetical protein